MATLLELLSRPDPLEGLSLIAIRRYWERPLDTVAVRAAAPPEGIGPVTGGVVVESLPVLLLVSANLRANLVANPDAGPGDEGSYVYGIALCDPERVVAMDLWEAPIPAVAGQTWTVAYDLVLIGPGDVYA